MDDLIRKVWYGAAAVAGAGALAFLFAYDPTSLAHLRRVIGAYLEHAVSSRVVVIPGFLAVIAGLAALALAPTAPARTRARAAPPRSALEPLDADVAKEMLLALSTRLRARAQSTNPDMVGFVDSLLDGAIQLGASDVHLHPLEESTRVAFRVQGVLEEVVAFPREHHRQLVSRLKVLARLNTFRADRPQDGHFTFDAEGGHRPADIRLSVLPTNHGEKAVLRVANVGRDLPDLGALGFPDGLSERYRAVLSRPQGLIFVSGPTGSGKTTTIYASLGSIKRTRGGTTQIATIEDPVEFDVPFLTQTQVSPEVGLTFAQGLRSILRQDPNVIMVGEIRDSETAHIAVQAGLTGHQIVTTVHADSAAGAFNRLIEMGVEPFLLASASLASLAQRLVRALCPYCRQQVHPTSDEAARLAHYGLQGDRFWDAPGCKRCDMTGYLGRTALFELLVVTPAIRELMTAKVPTSRIHDAAVADGMEPLLHVGIARARAGATTLREVFRVCG